MTDKEYMTMLQNHDWFYDYSDDHRVWQEGVNERQKLRNAFVLDERFKKMYNDWYDYVEGKTDVRPKSEDYV